MRMRYELASTCLTYRYASHAPQLLSDNYFVGSSSQFIIGLLYDDPTPSHTLVARQLPTNIL